MREDKSTTSRKLRPSRPIKFTLFPKLPPELRDRVWKFAVPGPRIVTVDAGNSIIRATTTLSSDCIDTFRIKYKYKFKLGFSGENEDPGMLRACKESRHVAIKMLPIRLPSRDPKKEIRLGLHDVLAVQNLERFLEDMCIAHSHGFNIHPSISQIPALVIFSHSSFGDDLENFMDLVEHDAIFQDSLQVLKSLQTLVFCCERRNRSASVKKDCFLNYATNFDPSALNSPQSRLLMAAISSQLLYKELMNDWKLKNKHVDLKIPETKIMAKGWPAKRI